MCSKVSYQHLTSFKSLLKTPFISTRHSTWCCDCFAKTRTMCSTVSLIPSFGALKSRASTQMDPSVSHAAFSTRPDKYSAITPIFYNSVTSGRCHMEPLYTVHVEVALSKPTEGIWGFSLLSLPSISPRVFKHPNAAQGTPIKCLFIKYTHIFFLSNLFNTHPQPTSFFFFLPSGPSFFAYASAPSTCQSAASDCRCAR